jgi:DNA-binding NarL/FixJ family response regulator
MQVSAGFKAVVAIAEDHADLAQGLALLIDHQADLCCGGTAADSTALLALFARQTLDACLLDLWLADGSSLPLISTLHQQQPRRGLDVARQHARAVAFGVVRRPPLVLLRLQLRVDLR